MRTVHKVFLIALVYGIIYVLVTWIFFRDYVTWAALGVLTALFNHSRMINVVKGPVDKRRIMLAIAQRYLLYIVMFAVAFFDTRDLPDRNVMTTTFIFLLIGFVAVKVATIIYALPFFKHENEPDTKEANDA